MSERKEPSNLPAHVVREIACASDTYPATVAKYVSGKTVRPLCAKRIDRALRALGLERLLQAGGA